MSGRRPSAGETRSDRLVRSLAQEIMDGRLNPGERLEEQSIADRFKVSRTPVREALQQLTATGLVARQPRRGSVVAKIDDRRLAEMFETMAVLEAQCARLAADRMSPDDKQHLRRFHEQSHTAVTKGGTEAYEKANFEFHTLIYRGSQNGFLEETTLAVRRRIAPFRAIQFRVPGRLENSFIEHGRVVDAIMAGDPDGAAREMTAHVDVVQVASHRYLDAPKAAQAEGRARPGPPLVRVVTG